MSLAGGSYIGLTDGEGAADPVSKTSDLPCAVMPNILGQCYAPKNRNHSPQKWAGAGGKMQHTNGKRDGNNGDEIGNNKLPEPCVILYKKKLDFTLPQNKTIGCGLLNIGNTCYINSTLQCLLYLPPWYNYVTKEHQQECNISSVDCIVCMFHRFLKSALNYHGSSFAPREIVDKLKYFCANMVRGRQEDAHEFLVSFVDRLQMSLLKGLPSRLVDSSSQYTTAVYKVFGIVIRSQVRCKACGWRSNNYEFGLNLILGIKNVRSLLTAFKLYTKKELMDGANAYNCEKCHQRQPAEKHLSVQQAPNVLIVQLLRYDQNEFGNTKLTQHIEFTESLDLGQFMSETEAQPSHHVYQLHGVLVHTGLTIQSGHYFAFVRGMDRKWYKMNDERVHEVSFEEVMSTQAYILFYVRKVKEPQQKPPVSSPAPVKHKPVFTPSSASNANYISHKPVICPANPNGNSKSETNGSSKPRPVSTNGGPSVNGSGDVAKTGNSAATSLGSSSVLNKGTKELTSNTREKVVFKISRTKDRWNGNSCNGSKQSVPLANPKTIPASGSVSNLPLVAGETKKLVAYDDESSDQESDKSVEPVRGISALEKSGIDSDGCAIRVEVETATNEVKSESVLPETGKATSGISLTNPSKATLGWQTSKVLDLEMSASKRVTSEKPHLKRSSSDSDLRARLLPVTNAPTVSRNADRRLSSGDGESLHGSVKLGLASEFKLCTVPLANLNDDLKTPLTVNSTKNLQGSLQTSSERPLNLPTDSPKTHPQINGSNSAGSLQHTEALNPAVDAQCNHPLTDVIEDSVAMDSSASVCRSKKRHRSSKDDSSSSCKRGHRKSNDSAADGSFEYIWVEKTFESINEDGSGESHSEMLGLNDGEAAENPGCSSKKRLRKSEDRDRCVKQRSRSIESRTHPARQQSSSSSHRLSDHCSRLNHQERNGDREDGEVGSKLPHRSSKGNGRRHRSNGSSDDSHSFDPDIESCHRSHKRRDRMRRSRSSVRSGKLHRSKSSRRSSKQDDRRCRSRSSHRSIHQGSGKRRSTDRGSERRRSRSPRRKYSSSRDRRRSRSSYGRRNSDVISSKSYDYRICDRNRYCRENIH